MSKPFPIVKANEEDFVNEVCSEIVLGKSLRSIAEDKKLTISWLWGLLNNDLYKDQYTRARQQQADKYAQEIVEIADREPDPQRARVMIDARKWIACKMLPKLYGDKVIHSGTIDVDWRIYINGTHATSNRKLEE